jgi:hypothetical protein
MLSCASAIGYWQQTMAKLLLRLVPAYVHLHV